MIIKRVAALFKAGGYLSFDNFAMRAKSAHLEADPYAWDPALERALAEAMRSVGRGTGTSRQSVVRDYLTRLSSASEGAARV